MKWGESCKSFRCWDDMGMGRADGNDLDGAGRVNALLRPEAGHDLSRHDQDFYLAFCAGEVLEGLADDCTGVDGSIRAAHGVSGRG